MVSSLTPVITGLKTRVSLLGVLLTLLLVVSVPGILMRDLLIIKVIVLYSTLIEALIKAFSKDVAKSV